MTLRVAEPLSAIDAREALRLYRSLKHSNPEKAKAMLEAFRSTVAHRPREKAV